MDTWEQIQAMEKRRDAAEEGDTETFWKFENDLQDLFDKRRLERDAEIPCLPCCDLGRDHISSTDLDVQIDGEQATKLAWVISAGVRRSSGSLIGGRVAVTFCPFCGVPVPGFRKKASPPPHLHLPESDGDYCGNCQERSRGCMCSYVVSAWEPDV